jgi:hypothetical protein
MHAVALGNTGDCAEALREIAIAIDYGGDNAQFRRTRDELTAAMREIRQKARPDSSRAATAPAPEKRRSTPRPRKDLGRSPNIAFRSDPFGFAT